MYVRDESDAMNVLAMEVHCDRALILPYGYGYRMKIWIMMVIIIHLLPSLLSGVLREATNADRAWMLDDSGLVFYHITTKVTRVVWKISTTLRTR